MKSFRLPIQKSKLKIHKLDSASFLLSARDELGRDGKLLRGESHGLARRRFINAFNLVEYAARLDDCDPVFGRALAFAHARFRRLLRNGLVREHAYPDFAAALDVARHGDTRGLNLPVRYPGRLKTF